MYLSLAFPESQETKACLQVVYFWMWPQEAEVLGRESKTEKDRKSVWGSAIEMTMSNWCLIPPRPSEGPHECDSDPLSRGSGGKHVSRAPVPQLPRLASCMACTSRINMLSQFLRFPCCKIRKASRQNNEKYLAQAWRAGLSSTVQLQLPEGGQNLHSMGWNQEDFEGVTKMSPMPSGKPVYFCMEVSYMFTQRHAKTLMKTFGS